MDTTTSMKPKTMAELLPGLSGILSKDTMQTLTSKKQPRQTIAQTRTAEKVIKPLTVAEMRADILALRVQSPRRYAQAATTSKKKIWNSSVKLEKTVSHTSNGQMKHNSVRKVLNFQPKPKSVPTMLARKTYAPESPKFTKPDFRPKKSLLLQARNNVRISGICNISETPLVTKPVKSRMNLTNKENISNQASIRKLPLPKHLIHKKQLIPVVPDTPLSNDSWKSSCDASFLQHEKKINDVEAKTKAIAEEPTLENIAEVTPPVSTPFKEYRNVKEYFNNSSEIENSAACNDDTIMCFGKHSLSNENNHREESVIVSLCDLLNKATVTNSDKISTELEDLLQIEEQAERNLKMIDTSISFLNKIKDSQLTSLKYVRKLIKEKEPNRNMNTSLKNTKETPKAIKMEKISPKREHSPSKPCSVIKSPSYKIPKKNLCLRKRVFHKSLPNVASEVVTPMKTDMGNRALSMYMKMKEHMNFLSTPVRPNQNWCVPNTPAVTSHNLQRQLDKLYDEN